MAQTTLTYLTGLAVADATASAGFIVLGPFRCNPDMDNTLQMIWKIYEIFIFLPIVNSFGQASVWITLAISAERCIFVTWSTGLTGNKEGLWPQYTKKIVIAIFLASIIFNIPFYFYYDIGITLNTGVSTVSDFGKSVTFEIWTWLRVILGKIIPIIGVIVFNFILVQVTWMNNKKYRAMNLATFMFQKRQKAQDRMTAMLISISTVFAVTHALEPFLISNIYTMIAGPCSNYTDLYNTLLICVNTAEAVSFASNFVSYCCFNKQFVETLKELFSCFKCCCRVWIRLNSVVNSSEYM